MAKYNQKIPYACTTTPQMERMGLNGQTWTTNELLSTYGKEYIRSSKDTMYEAKGITYYNAGDTYAQTLCFFRGNWKVCSIGDIIEKHPKLFND